MTAKQAVQCWDYTYAGLRITSELPISEWAAFESGPSPQPDVIITLANGPLENVASSQGGILSDVDDEKFISLQISAEEYHFRAPNAGEYWVRHGHTIQISPVAGAGEREIRLFLLGSAWGALCYQRRKLALHASVVRVGEKGVAFCGASGAGKSSTAAWLVRQGYPLVSDDLCCFDFPPEGPPLVYPSAPRLKLWREAIDILGWQEQELERDHARLDKYHLVGLPELRDPWFKPLPLSAIYLLDWGEPAITRLSGLNALQRLVATATYRPDLLEPMGQVAAHWQRCARLIQHTPVYEFSRPHQWPALESSMQQLTAGWQI
jgi:hypothetical protein